MSTPVAVAAKRYSVTWEVPGDGPITAAGAITSNEQYAREVYEDAVAAGRRAVLEESTGGSEWAVIAGERFR